MIFGSLRNKAYSVFYPESFTAKREAEQMKEMNKYNNQTRQNIKPPQLSYKITGVPPRKNSENISVWLGGRKKRKTRKTRKHNKK
jgi:hypothetical protein